MASVTTRDVAKYAGVGIGTVSRVLNGSPMVSEDTRQKVQAAVEAGKGMTDYASGVADPDTALSEIDASWLTE